ncbi:AGC family protein kinase [Tritrichomonas foetus]|uniref:AGC family protein kinase n=1 Tax=Tritrichomonas foetus TaxID=1144522 RepID=A0A1J4KU09_9EUKA|nr:AGC family protein kinase [Tritrichomonas foetus]|eukprot:OHT14769.1 AGC family protein kinase [Tritrichomonas foetus]
MNKKFQNSNYSFLNLRLMSLEITGFPFDLNGYQFLECIGSGTYSTCFKVFSHQYQQYFCAKMTEIQDENFFDENGNPRDQELSCLLQLDHQGVIKVYKYFRYDCFFFLILELCDAGTLSDRLLNGRKLTIDMVYSYMIDILEALVYCHQQNIAHRDIKPQNIFIDEHEHAKVADFGLSSVLKARHDLVDTACGSPSYASPEIYGATAYDPFKADVFALGVTFYQMLVRNIPWPDEITTAGPERPPPIFPRILGAPMISLIKSMLEIDPMKRPSMEQILNNDVFVLIRKRLNDNKNQLKSSLAFRTQSKEVMHPPISSYSMQNQKIMQHMILTQQQSLSCRLTGKKRRNSARIMNKTFGSDY